MFLGSMMEKNRKCSYWPYWSRMAPKGYRSRIDPNCLNDPQWHKMDQSGPKWTRMVQNGLEWLKWYKMVQDDPNDPEKGHK